MNKQGKMSPMASGFVWVLVVIGAIAVIMFGMSFLGVEQATFGDDSSSTMTTTCPSDLTWSGTVNVQNLLNESGTQTYDASAYFYKAGTDTLKTTITDTTSGSVTLTCGESYDVKLLSTGTTTGTGDAGKIISFSAAGATVNSDGSATFTATGDGEVLTIGTWEWGTLEIRLFDNSLNDFVQHPDGGKTNFSWLDGENYTGAGVNGFDVDSGGELDLTYELRAYNASLAYNEFGVYMLVDADTQLYDVPTVRIDGSIVSSIKNSLSSNEAISYADYEYVYLIDESKPITLNDRVEIDFFMQALSGIDPGTDTGTNVIQVDFAPIGTYATTANSNILAIGAVDDSSSRTQVHNLHDTFITVIDD